MNRPPATVSVDLDPVDLHLEGYGVRGLPPDPRVWTAALPRLLERFARAGVRATFFLVARDAAPRAREIRAIGEAGHEVASHSLTHPMTFARLARVRQREELVESKRRLEDAGGQEVVGFRAPNFDLDRRALAAVAEAGYRYDASAYPTALLLAARLAMAVRAPRPLEVLRLRPWPFTMERAPQRMRVAGREIHEFPISVTPGIGMPVYHTLRYLTAPAAFLARLAGFAARGEALSYILHGVDALGLVEDGVDPRLRSHPGMALRLPDKLGMLDEVLTRIAGAHETRPFRERLADLPG